MVDDEATSPLRLRLCEHESSANADLAAAYVHAPRVGVAAAPSREDFVQRVIVTHGLDLPRDMLDAQKELVDAAILDLEESRWESIHSNLTVNFDLTQTALEVDGDVHLKASSKANHTAYTLMLANANAHAEGTSDSDACWSIASQKQHEDGVLAVVTDELVCWHACWTYEVGKALRNAGASDDHLGAFCLHCKIRGLVTRDVLSDCAPLRM